MQTVFVPLDSAFSIPAILALRCDSSNGENHASPNATAPPGFAWPNLLSVPGDFTASTVESIFASGLPLFSAVAIARRGHGQWKDWANRMENSRYNNEAFTPPFD